MVYGKFSCITEALSFVDGGDALFIELLYLIDNLNASKQIQAMNHVYLGHYKMSHCSGHPSLCNGDPMNNVQQVITNMSNKGDLEEHNYLLKSF